MPWHVIEEVKALPPMKDMYGEGYDPHAYALSKFPALYALELHHWTEAAALTPAAGADSGDKAITYWARAIGAARSGNVTRARQDIAELESIRQEMLKNKKSSWAQVVEAAQKEAGAWVAHAEGKDEEAIRTLRSPAEDRRINRRRTRRHSGAGDAGRPAARDQASGPGAGGV